MNDPDSDPGIRSYIPNIITFIRLIGSPILLIWYLLDLQLLAILLLVLLVFSDFFDGFVARWLHLSSKSAFEAYFDALADFLVIYSMFIGFVINRVYPFWILLIIGIMFLQFILTSDIRRPKYDPIGKYTGLFLFSVIFGTLLLEDELFHFVFLIGILGFTLTSLTSRILTLK